jgi:hypothetical protein
MLTCFRALMLMSRPPQPVEHAHPLRRGLALVVLTIVLTLSLAPVIQAACSWRWDCTNGQCQQLPLCDYSSEIPPLRPLETPPVTSPSLRPIQPYVFAPPGKRACRDAYICSSSGDCRWKSVCE